jgi:hypothetical protein
MGRIGKLLPDSRRLFLFAAVAPVRSLRPGDNDGSRGLQNLRKREKSALLVTNQRVTAATGPYRLKPLNE